MRAEESIKICDVPSFLVVMSQGTHNAVRMCLCQLKKTDQCVGMRCTANFGFCSVEKPHNGWASHRYIGSSVGSVGCVSIDSIVVGCIVVGSIGCVCICIGGVCIDVDGVVCIGCVCIGIDIVGGCIGIVGCERIVVVVGTDMVVGIGIVVCIDRCIGGTAGRTRLKTSSDSAVVEVTG